MTFWDGFYITCFALSAVFLIAAVAMFFGFHIPELFKTGKSALEKKQIDDIRARQRKDSQSNQNGNIFEEMEKKARAQSAAQGIKHQTATFNQPVPPANEGGTSLLKKKTAVVNPNFIIEKNIVFVSTDEVI